MTGSIGPMGIASYAGNSSGYGSTYDRQLGLGAGAFLDLLFDEAPFVVRTALLYVNRNFREEFEGAVGTINSKTLEIPVIVKWKFYSPFSFGLGVYYLHTIGQLSVEANGTQYSQGYAADSNSTVPWMYGSEQLGWITDLGVEAALSAHVDMVGDVTYQRDFWGRFYTASDFQFAVGLRYRFSKSDSSSQGQQTAP